MRIVLLTLSLVCSLAASADPFQLTLEGRNEVLRDYRRQAFLLEDSEIIRKIHNPLLNEEFEVALNFHGPTAPMVVFIPGTFGGYDSAEIIRLGQLLFQKGFNILRFPNTISRHLVKHNPVYDGLDFETEAQLYIESIREIQKDYPSTEIHFAGASYGAFIGAVIAAKMPEFNGKVVLISPPKNILSSLEILDGYFDSMADQFHEFPWAQIKLGLKMVWAQFWGTKLHAPPEQSKVLLIVNGFHGTFRELFNQIQDFRQGKRPWYRFYESWSEENKRKQFGLRFLSYLKNHNSKFFSDSQKHEVLYWLEKSGRPWHIYTSEDDFINQPQPWPDSKNITTYKEGGHIFGFMYRPEFLKSFESLF